MDLHPSFHLGTDQVDHLQDKYIYDSAALWRSVKIISINPVFSLFCRLVIIDNIHLSSVNVKCVCLWWVVTNRLFAANWNLLCNSFFFKFSFSWSYIFRCFDYFFFFYIYIYKSRTVEFYANILMNGVKIYLKNAK